MAVELTSNAANHVQAMLAKRGHGLGLRLATRKSGCSGFAYVVEYADTQNEDDLVFLSTTTLTPWHKNSRPALDGTEVDYIRTNAINQGFEFRNPNVKDACGCGESFSV